MAQFDAVSGAGTLRLIVTQGAQSIPLNQTTVSWELHLYCYNGASWNASAVGWSVSINGTPYSGSYTFDFRGPTDKLIASGSTTVTHNADGTKSISVSGHTDHTGTGAIGGPIDTGGSMGLTTIPRATTPTVSPTSGDTGVTYTITHTPATSTFYHDVAYSIDGGGSYVNIATNVAGTTTTTGWTPASTLLPNDASKTAIIRVITRQSSGGTIIGTKTVNLPLTVPTTVVPTISSVAWADGQVAAPDMPTLMGGAGRFVQRWSKLKPTVTSAGAGGSTIISSKVQQGSQETDSGTAFGLPVSTSGAVPFTAQVIDSRARVNAAYAGTVAVTAYNFPNLPIPLVARTSDAAGLIPSPTGTYIAITPAASVSSLLFSASEKNLIEYQIRTRVGAGAWTVQQAWTAVGTTGMTWITKKVLAGPFSSSTEYQVEISIRDVFGKNGYDTGNTIKTQTVLVPSESVVSDWDEDLGLGLGGYRRDPWRLDVYGKIGQENYQVLDTRDLTTTIAALVSAQSLLDMPIGFPRFALDAVESAQWKLYNGQAISRTGFPLAFAYFGTTYGVGNGSTTFNLPNFPAGSSPVQSRGDVTLGTITVVTATDVFTCSTAHNLAIGDLVYVTGGTLPTGMTSGQLYAVKSVPSATTFTLSSTTVPTGTLLNLTATGSGTRTLFNATLRLGLTGGEILHTQSDTEVGIHDHPILEGRAGAADGNRVSYNDTNANTATSSGPIEPNAGGLAMNNMQPFIAGNWFCRVS